MAAGLIVTTDQYKKRKTKRKDYAFRRQINEKPSIIPGCPGTDQCDLHRHHVECHGLLQDSVLSRQLLL